MIYRFFLISFLLLVHGMGPVFAQETRYRVEILVLRHLEQNEEPLERLELPDFSRAVDFLTPVVEEEAPVDEDSNEMAPEGVTETDVHPLTGDTMLEIADVTTPPEDPNRVVHIEEMSNVMQETWRRLRLSSPFRPEQYLSWEQGSQEPFPSLRLHDLTAVMMDDPWAAFRPEAGSTGAVFTDAGDEIAGPALPDPVTYYRLDGTVTLRRSRFLHLDLDLQYREPVWPQDAPVAQGSGETGEQAVQPSSFRVYELKQDRQVRTGRMEYFDSPSLGVLAWITEIEEESGETP